MEGDRFEGLAQAVDRAATDFSGRYGLAVIDFAGGGRFEIGAQTPFVTASLIKLPIHSVWSAAVALGQEDPDAMVTVRPEDVIGGGGIVHDLDLPAAFRLRDLATLMVTISDNVATNLVIRHLGIDRINAWLADQGFGDGIRLYRELVGDDDPPDPLAHAKPAAVADYLAALRAGRFPGSDKTLATAARQQHRNQMGRQLPLGEGGGLTLANKPGSDAGIRTDAGLLRGNGRDFAFAMMTGGASDKGFGPDHEGEVFIGRVCRLVYDRLA